MKDFQEQFSARLKKLRVASGLSQEELAEAVGVATKTVSYWENGHNAVTFNKIPLIAKALNIPVYKLFVFGETLTSNSNQDIIDFLSSMTEKERRAVLTIIEGILILK